MQYVLIDFLYLFANLFQMFVFLLYAYASLSEIYLIILDLL